MSKTPSSAASSLALVLRKFVVSTFVVGSFIAYVVHDRLNADSGDDFATSIGAQNAASPAARQLLPAPPPTATLQPRSATIDLFSSAPQQAMPTEPPAMPTAQPVVPTAVPPTAAFIPPATAFVPPTTAFVPPTATDKPEGQYRDGVYDGPVVDAIYGYVQVEATIQDGKLTDVQFLRYPDDRRTSRRINSVAMPYLMQEAVQAQSAYIDIISGATLTSEAFAQSLNTVLTQQANRS